MTEMHNGLTATLRVRELMAAMEKERDFIVKNAADLTRQCSAVASAVTATENKDCLDLFLQLDGLHLISKWLKDAQKLGDDKVDNSVEESIAHVLQALEKLDVDYETLVASEIWTSVQNLLVHNSSKVQDKARALFEIWKSRTDSNVSIFNADKAGAFTDDEAGKSADIDRGMGHSGTSLGDASISRETSVNTKDHELTRDDPVLSTSSDAVHPDLVESANNLDKILNPPIGDERSLDHGVKMDASLIISVLLCAFGYLYPTWESLKAIWEHNIEHGFFWLPYWMPMLREAKLVALICLHLHKTQGVKMDGSLIIGGLLCLFSYLYPASETWKTIAHHDMEQASFWLRYWMLFGGLLCVEYCAPRLIDWIPRLSAVKLVFVICLYLHKTKIANHVYEFSKPYLPKIRERILTLKTIAPFIWKIFADYFQNKIDQNAASQQGWRMVWFVFAFCSMYIGFCIMVGQETFPFKEWLIHGIRAVVPVPLRGDYLEDLPNALFFVTGIFYTIFLCYLNRHHEIRPIRLPRYARWSVIILLILVCLVLSWYVNSFWGMVFGFLVCFHLIPLVNLLGAYENFNLIHYSLLLLSAVVCSTSRDPKYTPYALVILLAVLLVLMILLSERAQ